MIEPTGGGGDMFTQVKEKANELASDQDDELGGVLPTSPRRTRLIKHNTDKIVKLCSPVFRVELVRKRGGDPQILKL